MSDTPAPPADWQNAPTVRKAYQRLFDADDAYYHEMPTDMVRQYELEHAYSEALEALMTEVAKTNAAASVAHREQELRAQVDMLVPVYTSDAFSPMVYKDYLDRADVLALFAPKEDPAHA